MNGEHTKPVESRTEEERVNRRSHAFVSNGKSTVELEIGWYKEWMCENVYGWHFVGPPSEWSVGGPYVHLVVLSYEPSLKEVAEIRERFKDAIAPDGTRGLEVTTNAEGRLEVRRVQ